MNHQDHVYLLQKGVCGSDSVWADLGAGRGAFTLALSELLGPESVIYAVDRDPGSLRHLARSIETRFPAVTVHTIEADFTRPLDLPPLEGIVMANALHFLRHKEATVQLLRSYLGPGGRFILVEYNVDRGNRWVPYPLSYSSWAALAKQAGFAHTELLATVPSSFLGEFYAAMSW
jgi:23S rRNA U2552 (ribose-2'-O)-methylase RlmE/FtsJ